MKRQLKKSVVYALYTISFALILGGILVIALSAPKSSNDEEYDYVSKGILDYEQNVKVVSNTDVIKRPYVDENVVVVKNFYDYKSDSDVQERSLIYYEGTYIQSTGVSYSNGGEFNVVSILPGKVKEIKEDTTLGNVITIEHENGIVSVYQSIKDISVNEGDEVAQSQIIAKSSTSNISSELDNHLYFELIINGANVNPEDYYNKSVDEI